jgi:hypothetical protein
MNPTQLIVCVKTTTQTERRAALNPHGKPTEINTFLSCTTRSGRIGKDFIPQSEWPHIVKALCFARVQNSTAVIHSEQLNQVTSFILSRLEKRF